MQSPGQRRKLSCGGEGGIRTPDTVARTPHFECGAFNHSATSPTLNAAFRFHRAGPRADPNAADRRGAASLAPATGQRQRAGDADNCCLALSRNRCQNRQGVEAIKGGEQRMRKLMMTIAGAAAILFVGGWQAEAATWSR